MLEKETYSKPPNEYLVQPLSSAGLRLPIAHEPPAPQSPNVGPWPAGV